MTLTLEISLLDSLIHELSILKKQFKTHLFNLFKLFFLYHHSKSTMTSYALPFNTKKRVTILSFYSMYKNCNFPQMFVGDTLSLAYLELSINTEQTGVVFNEPGLFGFVQETHEQQQLLQSEAGQRLLVA